MVRLSGQVAVAARRLSAEVAGQDRDVGEWQSRQAVSQDGEVPDVRRLEPARPDRMKLSFHPRSALG